MTAMGDVGAGMIGPMAAAAWHGYRPENLRIDFCPYDFCFKIE
jgi:hypothetical protein